MRPDECGGCNGLGRHARECQHLSGMRAAMFHGYARRAESLGDSVGPNDMGASSTLWALASRFRAEAARAATEWHALNDKPAS